MIDYRTVLPKGKEQAISGTDLAMQLGFSSVRALQKDIEAAREIGIIILSSSTGGYYLPGSNEEIEEFIRTLKARALNTLKTLKHARRYLNETQGQISLDDVTM